MERYLGAVLILALIIFAKTYFPSTAVLGEVITQPIDTLEAPQPVVTETRFSEKLEEHSETLLKKTTYKDNPEVEAGIETIVDEGEDGKKVRIIKITFFEGEEYSREVVSTETTPPKDKIISRGTKIVWKTLDSSDGQISYWKKIRVYATHYDSSCPGCNETTATGLRAGKGVIAVDPKVIPLRSKVYIPGYGVAVAGDTGGSIKGNIIDLGFDDAKTAGWTAKFIDIYLL